MLPIHRILWHESGTPAWMRPARQPEPMTMEDPEQVGSYVDAYAWGGPASAVQLHHLKELSRLIRPGDLVVDLACGPGPLLLELAAIYPTCRFVGVDMSRPMLARLESAAAAAGLGNVTTRCEDIRRVPSLERRPDVIISTSALHHLGGLADLRAVFGLIGRMGPGGAFYLFDFGALRSPASRRICVEELARSAPRLTALDYAMSLDAAFPIDEVFALAQELLPRPCLLQRSALADFCYLIQSPPRTRATPQAAARIAQAARLSGFGNRIDHLMLRLLRRSFPLPEPPVPAEPAQPARLAG